MECIHPERTFMGMTGLVIVAISLGCTSDAPQSVGEPTPTSMSMFYDLMAHPDRAEIGQGRAVLIDLGTPGANKYAPGGLWPGWRSHPDVEGRSVVSAVADHFRVVFPVEFHGAGHLALRFTTQERGWMYAWIDGRPLKRVRLTGGGEFTILAMGIPSDLLGRGDHALRLLMPSGSLLDWVRLSPSGDPGLVTQEFPVFEQAGQLVLPAGISLGWLMELPPEGELRISAHARGTATFSINIWGQGIPPSDPETEHGEWGWKHHAGRFGATEQAMPVSVDLRALAGQVVRIELTAEEGDVVLDSASVYTTDIPHAETTMIEPPANIVIFLVDTLRADRLTIYEPEARPMTAGVERLAADAAVFERGQSQASWTKPSVATLMTSLPPWDHGARSHHTAIHEEVVLLPEHFQAAGWHTAGFVTNGYVSDAFGFQRGWDTWSHSVQTGRGEAHEVIDDVLQWISERPEGERFFLYVHTTTPHSPYDPPPDILAMHDPSPYNGPVDLGADTDLLRLIRSGQMTVADRDIQRLEALYDAEVTEHDLQFDRFLEGLDTLGRSGDTLIVFIADHGEEFHDHGSVGHSHSLYQELLHVPYIIRWPGVTDDGMRVREPVGTIDLAPTLLDIAGLPLGEGMQGHSLAPILLGDSLGAPNPCVGVMRDSTRSLLLGRYKLIATATGRYVVQYSLYDLEQDPGELLDIAVSEPLTLRYLRGLLNLLLAAELANWRSTPVPTAPAVAIDPATLEQLRALGYIANDSPGASESIQP